jgi:hypothetical protein
VSGRGEILDGLHPLPWQTGGIPCTGPAAKDQPFRHEGKMPTLSQDDFHTMIKPEGVMHAFY